jgi:hypothetical protein
MVTSQDQDQDQTSLRDELGINDLSEPIVGARGKLFAAAGREAPVAEFTEQSVVLHPPQLPFQTDKLAQLITESASDRGVLLDASGNELKVAGAKYRGAAIFYLKERDQLTGKHLVGWFADSRGEARIKPSYLYHQGKPMTDSVAIEFRNKTLDGEIAAIIDQNTETSSVEQN